MGNTDSIVNSIGCRCKRQKKFYTKFIERSIKQLLVSIQKNYKTTNAIVGNAFNKSTYQKGRSCVLLTNG